MRHPSHPEALQLLGTLRDLFPGGEASPTLLASYAELLTIYDGEVVARAFNRLMHERTYSTFPTWAQIEQALAAESPAVAAWISVEAQLAARTNTPPLWDDPDTAPAIVKLGGWTVLLEWDGSPRFLRDLFVEAHDQHRWQRERDASARPRLGTGITKRLNLTGADRCHWCADSGWATLLGTIIDRSVTYERGVAPCRWCEAGEAAYRSATTGRQSKSGSYWPPLRAVTDYGESDIVAATVEEPGEPITAAEYAASQAGKADPALRDAAVREMLGV